MSSGDYSSSSTYSTPAPSEARSAKEAEALRLGRAERLAASRSKGALAAKSAAPRPVRDDSHDHRDDMIRSVVTRPDPKAARIYQIVIDNSGSNATTAKRMRDSSNYLIVNLKLIDPRAQFMIGYFSDHSDGTLLWQPIDYLYPDPVGQQILVSTTDEVEEANGDDNAEAHECILRDLTRSDFGHVAVPNRHLIMVTDVVGHGMDPEHIMGRDNRCPFQVDWQQSLDLVEQAYGSFELVGSGDNLRVANLQEQFIAHAHPELIDLNFVSLAGIHDSDLRLGLVPNAVLFLVARQRGLQSVEAFLGRLYEKWLLEPIFGEDSDNRAREAIARFGRYLDLGPDDLVQFMGRVLAIGNSEASALIERIKQGEFSF